MRRSRSSRTLGRAPRTLVAGPCCVSGNIRELKRLAAPHWRVNNQTALIIVLTVFGVLLGTRYVLALRRRPALLKEIWSLMEIAGDATSLLDETLERYPQWRSNHPLAAELYRLEEIGTEVSSQVLRIVFGNPVRATDRLAVLAPLLSESVQDITDQVDGLLNENDQSLGKS